MYYTKRTAITSAKLDHHRQRASYITPKFAQLPGCWRTFCCHKSVLCHMLPKYLLHYIAQHDVQQVPYVDLDR